MLPLHTRARVRGVQDRAIVKVLTADEAIQSDIEPERCLIWLDRRQGDDLEKVEGTWAGIVTAGDIDGECAAGMTVDRYRDAGRCRTWRRHSPAGGQLPCIGSLPPRVEQQHDACDGKVQQLLHHVLAATAGGRRRIGSSTRCWKQFLWWIGTRPSSASVAVSRPCLATTCSWSWIGPGGSCRTPGLHILSNGRRFADEAFARTICAVRHPNLTWGIPVYSDCPEIHDYVVQARSAWNETLAGLHNLAKHGANIEIRIVVQRPNVERLGELAYFIFRNLTFARHVAFMGLEPIGFARTNYDQVWIDPVDCMDALSEAVFFLAKSGNGRFSVQLPSVHGAGRVEALLSTEHFGLEEHLSAGVRWLRLAA